MLNFPWLALPYVDTFAEDFTVVVVSPRSFGASTRLADGEHDVAALVDDIVAVCDHVEVESFALFGYSFSAAVSAWVSSQLERVTAVIAGGFPLLGDYARASEHLEERIAPILSDPVARAALEAQHDLEAGMTFYRHLASLPADALVDQMGCPLFAFWGTADETISWLADPRELERRLLDRGAAVRTLDGLTHEETGFAIGPLIPEMKEWLTAPG